MIRFLPTVRVEYFSPQLAEALEQASIWSMRTRIDVDVNSIDDGRHGATTLHGRSLAADLDTAGDKPADLADLYAWLAAALPAQWDVILESSHVHVEWDSRRRIRPTAPPAAGRA